MKRVFSDKKILILGSAVIDMIIKIAKLPNAGEDIAGLQQGYKVGGCAYNVSKILDNLQIKHDLCVPVGKGMYADIIKKELSASGHAVLIEDNRADNGYSLSLVEDSGERTFITIDGIETKWQDRWFANLNVQEYDYIYASGYGFQENNNSGDVILNFIQNKRDSCKLVLDPGPRLLGRRFADKVLRMNTILELNEHEALALADESELSSAVKKLYEITRNPIIVTMGSKGTMYYIAEKFEMVPPQKVRKVVDTIGAGDSHTAALIAGLASGLDLYQSCVLANKIAAQVVQKTGCNI